MNRIISLFVLMMMSLLGFGQVVVTDPVFPSAEQSVTITFNAAEGSGGLAGYNGDIYAHTGVITENSTSPGDWKYVIAGWSENTDKARLTSIGNDLWTLEIGPSIREFYGVPDGELIESLAFVFRSGDGSREGKTADGGDIFAPVYQAGLFITLTSPTTEFVVMDPGEVLQISAEATMADSILLFSDEALIAQTSTNTISHAFVIPETGIHTVVARVYAQGETAEDEFSFLVRGSEVVEELPAGLRQGANYIDDQTVTFVLFAPDKDLVFLIGDFNNWETNTDFLMKKTPDGNYFWITVDQLEPGKEYIYQYFIDGTIRVADPYTNQVSDPWNDHYIEDWAYPDLIHYPAGLTTQIASVCQTDQAEYTWVNTDFTPPPLYNLVAYELLIRDFMAKHTFAGLIDTLDYLDKLGVNVIELMPVNEFEGNDSWGYNPSFYFAVDKYYGPASTLKAFIDSAHGRGIAVVSDLVLNHSFGQSPLVRMYWDSENGQPAANSPWYNQQSPNPVYSWGYDFNHESEYTKAFVDSVNSYWLTEFQLDGFRFDFTKGFTNTPGDGSAYDPDRIAILQRMADEIWQVNPEAYVILEHFGTTQENVELGNYGVLIWGNFNHLYRIAAKGYLGVGATDLSSTIYTTYKGAENPSLMSYMESHDEERLMVEILNGGNFQNANHNTQGLEIALKRVELCANFFIPIPGSKMIWMFGELGYDYSIDYNGRVGRKPIRWDYYEEHHRKRLYQVYSELNKLKTSYPVFSTTDFTYSLRDSIKQLRLNHEEMNVTVLGNFAVWGKFGLVEFQHTGWWYDYWTGDSLFVENTEMWIPFEPSEYKLYTDVKLDTPDILSGVDELTAVSSSQIVAYPNPVSDQLLIAGLSGGENLAIYNSAGQLVDERLVEHFSNQMSISTRDWPRGIYYIRITGLEDFEYLKIVRE